MAKAQLLSLEVLSECISATKELLETKLSLLETKLSLHEDKDILRHQATGSALSIAADDIDRRLAEMNKFREQVSEERLAYLPKEIYEREHKELQRRVVELESVQSTETGKELESESAAKHRYTLVGITISIGTALVAIAIAIMHYYH